VRTLGIEEELLVVDARTTRPVTRSTRVISLARHRLEEDGPEVDNSGSPVRPGHQPGGHIGPELQRQQIEVDTPPRTDLADLHADLLSWRRAVASAAAQEDARVLASGTSPLPGRPRLTPNERYRLMGERYGITALEQLVCGCHVHVAVADDEEAVGALDRVRPWLPTVLAISANSPYWHGRDSGYASFRYQAWSRWPSAGPPDVFGSAAAYHSLVRDMVASGVLLDERMVYFDARLSSSYPTLEIRTADVCLDAGDAVLIGALCRALVETAVGSLRAEEPPAPVPNSMLRLASWQASKSGVDGPLLDPSTYRPRAAQDVCGRLVEHVRPALEDFDDLEFVRTQLDEVLRRGNGARRQRDVKRRTGSLLAVVTDLADATASSP
jgi:carboxylate-amine ligase